VVKQCSAAPHQLQEEGGGVSLFTGSGVPLVPDGFLFGALLFSPSLLYGSTNG
jgi:hypothetical protein